MKKTPNRQSAFFHLRTSAGLLLTLAGVSLAVFGLGQFQARAEDEEMEANSTVAMALVPPMVDCAQMRAEGITRQENLRAGAIAIFCGDLQGGATSTPVDGHQIVQQILAPLLGTTDQDLITGTESSPHVTQSETFTAANPDNPNEIVVAYNDSRGVPANNISGASVSQDGGNTFTRLTNTSGQSPFANTFGDPVALYNRPTATWFTVWLDGASGGQGLGGFKSKTPSDPSSSSWTHFTVHSNSADDRESGWADNNPASPFYGRMYISYNDFNVGGGALYVRYSTDNGLTWTNSRQITSGSPFIRDVQITGDLATGTVFLAGIDEGGGGFPHNNINKMYRSTDGGNTWTNTYSGPTFSGPGRGVSGYFACMYNSPAYWRHEGWGQPAALNNIVHYVYDARNAATGDPADVFYIRSTDGGQTFSAPFQLNTNTDVTKAQWQPNLSVASDGSLLSVWYDEREGTTPCQPSNPTKPCYRMWARKSLDNGVTWLPDEPYSDVISPLPLQPDSSIVSVYVGDYDYGSSVLNQHIHAFVDGRKAINNASQQDAFVDREPASTGGGGAKLLSAASRLTHGSAGTFDVAMPLTGTSGVEDRDSTTYNAVFTFDSAVTSGTVQVVSGTATVGAISFSGNSMTAQLTGVTTAQIVTLRVGNINGDGQAHGDVPFGFLIADANANRTVDKPDQVEIRGQVGQPVNASNFRDDVIPDGTINRNDEQEVKTHKKQHL